MANTPHDMLRRLVVSAESGLPIPPEVASWWVQGVGRFLNDEQSLDGALGLTGPGVCRPSVQHAKHERDRWLCRAGELLVATPKGTWQMAGILAEKVSRYETTAWPRRRLEIPEDCCETDVSDHKEALFRAFYWGAQADISQPMPTSRRQFQRILDSDTN